jgi:Right handed beta helix region
MPHQSRPAPQKRAKFGLRTLLATLASGVIVVALAPALAQNGGAPFRVAETGQSFPSLRQAVEAIGDRDGTIIIASGRYNDCVVQAAGFITYRAESAGQVMFDGGICEGKAVLVLRGRGAKVDGIVFRGLTVSDGNGAGIRLEKGPLTVTNSMFRDSEQGILTGDDEASEIVIDRSTFSGLGRCDRGLSCAHSIYIGKYGRLTVTRSRFERGNGGHYVKSRAVQTRVTDSSFDDTRGRTTNYMIDLPDGSTGLIAGNMFVQGKDKENYSAFITVAPENRWNSSDGLTIENNDAKIAPGVDRKTVFVANWSMDRVNLGANRLGPNLTPYEKR